MKERPILFNAEMMSAYLAGLKTQTRRIAMPRRDDRKPCEHWEPAVMPGQPYQDGGPSMSRHCKHGSELLECPYGVPGDRLWVRETHRFDGIDQRIGMQKKRLDALWYRADMEGDRSCDDCAWRPSIHMPRWASRITLEVTGVRVERLQDITEADALAEGIAERTCGLNQVCYEISPRQDAFDTARDAFAALWDSLNAKREGCAWADNPWVFVVSFPAWKGGAA